METKSDSKGFSPNFVGDVIDAIGRSGMREAQMETASDENLFSYTPDFVAKVVAAQKNMESALEDSVGQAGAGRYRYADLSAIMRATRGAYNAAGLYIRSAVNVDWDAKRITAMTIITDGETIERACPVTIPIWGREGRDGARREPDEKTIGATITYARRYSWAAATSVDLSDDEDSIDQRTPTQPPAQRTPTQPPAKGAISLHFWGNFLDWLRTTDISLKDVSRMIGEEATQRSVGIWMGEQNIREGAELRRRVVEFCRGETKYTEKGLPYKPMTEGR